MITVIVSTDIRLTKKFSGNAPPSFAIKTVQRTLSVSKSESP